MPDTIQAYAKTYIFNPSILDVDKIQDEFGQWLEKETIPFLKFKISVLEEVAKIERDDPELFAQLRKDAGAA